jgi:hypothetical protein
MHSWRLFERPPPTIRDDLLDQCVLWVVKPISRRQWNVGNADSGPSKADIEGALSALSSRP